MENLPDKKKSIADLGDRQQKIARLIADGGTAKDAASKLKLSFGMARSDMCDLYKKLDVHSSSELQLLLDGLVPPDCTFQGLTSKQNDVARLLLEAKALKEIAWELGVGLNTVKRRIAAMKKNLGMEDVAGNKNPARLMKRLREVIVVPEPDKNLMSETLDPFETGSAMSLEVI
ncbi:MAG: response regulator transcription factor [Alphaproteobacteria bacterium]|jgi:DNA-binding NarL/FixJ family response regulator|nr:response regulator transcription factor [Alphaproteobacteria bacterium]